MRGAAMVTNRATARVEGGRRGQRQGAVGAGLKRHAAREQRQRDWSRWLVTVRTMLSGVPT
jgi:hypothetical protein